MNQKNPKISVHNFRAFQDIKMLKIKPLTILLGKNNSGKSNFSSLLLLIKNGVNTLKFRKDGILSYESALNKHLKKGKNYNTVIKSSAQFSFLSDGFIEKYKYNREGEIYQKTVINEQTKNLFFDLKIEAIKKSEQKEIYEAEYINIKKYSIVNFAINDLIDRLYAKEIIVPSGDHFAKGGIKYVPLKDLIPISKKELLENDNYIDQPYYLTDIVLEDRNSENFMESGIDTQVITNSIVHKKLNMIEQDYVLFKVYSNNVEITNPNLKKEIKNIQDEFFRDMKIDADIKDDLLSSLRSAPSFLSTKLELYFESKGYENIEVKLSVLGNVLFKEKVFDVFERNPGGNPEVHYFSFSIFQLLLRELFTSLDYLKRAQKVYDNRWTITDRILSPIYHRDVFNDFAFYQRKQNEQNINLDLTIDKVGEYLSDILRMIGIEKPIKTKFVQDSLSIYVETESEEINLADYGSAYRALIPFIIKLYKLMFQEEEQILVLDTPETNLDEEMQAKLAHIIKYLGEKFPKWKFVIETHSQIFIKELQQLVKVDAVKSENCVLHLFKKEENNFNNIVVKSYDLKAFDFNRDMETSNQTKTFDFSQTDLLNLKQEQSN